MSIQNPIPLESIQADETKAHERAHDDVLTRVLEDHAEIKRRFNALTTAGSAPDKREALAALIHKLVVHETAEREVIHPLTREATQGDAVADKRIAEEDRAEDLLARLEQLDVESRGFDDMITSLRRDVLSHAEAEQAKEFPKIEQAVDAEQLTRLAPIFRAAEASPSYPASTDPTSAVSHVTPLPLVAIAEQAREAIHNARILQEA
ncbi:hemerythrin domain-containing protein [uncultured Abyssibacter sp.]|uniref:hemerythrin domain-containing protein n=1 Tax=uncultured Abyssibacter sp. TaxID=2320202 RepID=UPI0032B2DBFE